MARRFLQPAPTGCSSIWLKTGTNRNDGTTVSLDDILKGLPKPLDPAEIQKLAAGYTAGWCSRSAEAMGAFFADFPDLVLHMDDLRTGGNKAIFLWTLEGTNSGPVGTGNLVRTGGWQNWRLSDDRLIVEADGGYDETGYDRQVREGV